MNTAQMKKVAQRDSETHEGLSPKLKNRAAVYVTTIR
jgi:hypothetical protein